MKLAFLSTATLAFVLLCGWRKETEVWLKDPIGHGSAIEVQMAVRSEAYGKGDGVNDGDFSIVTSWVLPISSTGGSGQAVCNQDGAIIEMEWSEVTLLKKRLDQEHPYEIQIEFDNLSFVIMNEIVLPDNVRHRLAFGGTSRLGTEFDWLVSPLRFSSEEGKNKRVFVIRGRFLPEIESAKPLPISALAGYVAGTDG